MGTGDMSKVQVSAEGSALRLRRCRRARGARHLPSTDGATMAHLWLHATYMQARGGGQPSRALIGSMSPNGRNSSGRPGLPHEHQPCRYGRCRRERGWEARVLGIATGPSEVGPSSTEVLRCLADRGLRGVEVVIADDQKGLRAAYRVFNRVSCRANDPSDSGVASTLPQ